MESVAKARSLSIGRLFVGAWADAKCASAAARAAAHVAAAKARVGFLEAKENTCEQASADVVGKSRVGFLAQRQPINPARACIIDTS